MAETIEQFEVRNRWTGAVQFTAEISVTPDMLPSVKLGLAVKWGVKAGANLADANLAGANLARANLADANLTGAYLADANLADAYLAGAKWRDGIPLTKVPVQIHGLRWPVTILDQHMTIGCQEHSIERWWGFSDALIAKMDKDALEFWHAHKATLQALCTATGRLFVAEVVAA